MKENYFESSKYLETVKKFKQNGPLGVTAADHEAIYSTPGDDLKANPGKTRAELMSDDDILKYLNETKESIAQLETSGILKDYIESQKKNLPLTIQYLEMMFIILLRKFSVLNNSPLINTLVKPLLPQWKHILAQRQSLFSSHFIADNMKHLIRFQIKQRFE